MPSFFPPRPKRVARAPRSSIEIAGLVSYRTVKAAREDLKRRIASYTAAVEEKGQCALSTADAELFNAVIRSHHPSTAEWVGLRTVRALRVRAAARKNLRPVLVIERDDSETLPFSLAKSFECFEVRESVRRTAVLIALRASVQDQLKDYHRAVCANGATSVRCALHRGKVDPREVRLFVCYRAPLTFEKLVQDFEKDLGVDADVFGVRNLLASAASQRTGASSKFKDAAKGVWELTDSMIEDSWTEFHAVHAVYDLVCASCRNTPHKAVAKRTAAVK